MTDTLLDLLFGHRNAARRAGGGPAAMVRDLWLGGMPLPRAAAAAGLTLTAAEETLRTLGFDPSPPKRPAAESSRRDPDRRRRAAAAPKRAWGRWSMLRADVVRLYGEGRTIRAVAAELGMHQREVWRQLQLAGVPRRPRGTAGVVLSRSTLQRLYVHERLSVAQVAHRVDVSPEAVVRNLERHGLPRRDRYAPLDRAALRRLY